MAPWPRFLAGKRVLVVHPFARSIQMQYARRSKVKSICDLLPDFELLTIVPPVICRTRQRRTWLRTSVPYERSRKATVRCALIGCGLMISTWSVRETDGRQASFGGATQILFGIRGKRWDEREHSVLLYGRHWVRL